MESFEGFVGWEFLNTGATFVLGTLMFTVLFLFFPAVKLKIRDVWLGAAALALGDASSWKLRKLFEK